MQTLATVALVLVVMAAIIWPPGRLLGSWLRAVIVRRQDDEPARRRER